MNSYNIGLEDRKIIEEMYNAGAKPCEIAARIGKCQATIYREIKRGEVPAALHTGQKLQKSA